jgi:hypothetical protein
MTQVTSTKPFEAVGGLPLKKSAFVEKAKTGVPRSNAKRRVVKRYPALANSRSPCIISSKVLTNTGLNNS